VYYNVNFNMLFKLIKVHLLVSDLYMVSRYFNTASAENNFFARDQGLLLLTKF